MPRSTHEGKFKKGEKGKKGKGKGKKKKVRKKEDT
jgi:hypothetical protein